MSDVVISVENLSKVYRLGTIGGRTLRQDYARWWAKKRGKPDPYLRIGQKDYSNQEGELVWALRDINMQVKQGEIVGIIGRNGAGKSTLLKILSRITAPTSGVVKIKGRIGSLLEVGTGFHPELTGRENVYLNGAILGMTKEEVAKKFDEMVDFSGVEQYIDTPVKRYSSGMHVRLAFAVAAHLDPEILLVDEVLAVGDAEFQNKCIGKLEDVAGSGRTVLFVSHNMAAVARLCTSAKVINEGYTSFEGDAGTAVSRYLEGTEQNVVAWENGPVRRVEIRQTSDSIDIYVDYSTDIPLRLPNVGFLITDLSGVPVCGTNAVDDGVSSTSEVLTVGTVKIEMTSPKLRTGTYRLSIWFGDGRRDNFIARDVATFSVVNTAGARERRSQQVGPVVPRCIWSFSS